MNDDNLNALMKSETQVFQPNGMMNGLPAYGTVAKRVQTGYTTAITVQQPRSLARTTKGVLDEAAIAGSDFYYRWEIKNKKTGKTSVVQGGSIELAMAIARHFGNCAVPTEVEETPTHYIFKAVFVDLETGFNFERLFRQRKSQSLGNYDADRQDDIVFQIGQSKAQRNAILKAVPSWLIDKAVEVARKAEIDNIKAEDITIARANTLSFFEKYGVTPDRIEVVIGRDSDHWTVEDIANLRGSAKALKEGRITAEELFPKTAHGTIPTGEDHTEMYRPKKVNPEVKENTEVKEQPEAKKEPDTFKKQQSENVVNFDSKVKVEVKPEVNEQAIEESSDPQKRIDDHFRAKWVNLRGPGFADFVYKNPSAFADVSELVKSEARAKWAKLYPTEKFPKCIALKMQEPPVETGPEIINLADLPEYKDYMQACEIDPQMASDARKSILGDDIEPNTPEKLSAVLRDINRRIDEVGL
jgi:hypothetical protein